jgi:hypothetical protein
MYLNIAVYLNILQKKMNSIPNFHFPANNEPSSLLQLSDESLSIFSFIENAGGEYMNMIYRRCWCKRIETSMRSSNR